MRRKHFFTLAASAGIGALLGGACASQGKKKDARETTWNFETDTFQTAAGTMKIVFIGHASLIFFFGNTVLYLDSWSQKADFSKLPKADIVLVTHEHIDHLDPKALDLIRTDKTVLLYAESCAKLYKGGKITRYGDVQTIKGIKIETMPAYNIVVQKNGSHPRDFANGYLLTYGGKRIYAAGETEKIPEMTQIKNIDIAFFSVDSIFNMTPQMAAEAAKIIKPKILYPIHFMPTFYNEVSDLKILTDLLKDTPEIEVRIRKMQ